MVGKLLKELSGKRKAKAGGAGKPKQLDEAQKKEFYDLSEQARSFRMDLDGVVRRMATVERDSKACAVTYSQIEKFPEETSLFKSVGKAYIKHDREFIQKALEEEVEDNNKNFKDLQDRKEYIERRLTSVNSNMKDLTTAAA